MRELLIGCGNSREKKMWLKDKEPVWTELTTLDADHTCKPDVEWNLEYLPYPFEPETFDEIHAYEVLEHVGLQGDVKFFFDQFNEFYRILKPDGLLFATVPAWNSVWAFGDPSHTRVISHASLAFLDMSEYHKQVGKTAMSDYRSLMNCNFKAEFVKYEGETFQFVLKAIK